MTDKSDKNEIKPMDALDNKTRDVLIKKGYELNKKLAEGTYGRVYSGTHKLYGVCAVKVVDTIKAGNLYVEKFLPRELAALISVKHENACHIFDIIRANYKIYIFMELCTGGDIAGLLQKGGAIDEERTCYWFAQVCEALKFLHKNLHMSHGDIKVDNIMLTDKDGVLTAKLTDFGFAKVCWDKDKNRPALSKTFCGTEPYYCPEMVSRKEYDPMAADVWAMGVVLFAMLNNKLPFHYGDAKKMLREQTDRKFIEGRFIKAFPDDLKDLQFKLWDVSETKRPEISTVIEHPWIKRKGK